MQTRSQSRPEEWANAASHAAGVLLVVAVWPWLAAAAQRQGGAQGVAAMAVFALTMASCGILEHQYTIL